MKATQQLKKEHEHVELSLEVLEEICRRLKTQKPIIIKHLLEILEFLEIFVDKCHHMKEEDVLFPALEKAGIPKEGGPLRVMLIEHDEGRRYVKGLSEAISRFDAGDKKAADQVIENAVSYIDLLRQHIDKENNILFMIADMHLSEDQQKILSDEFDKIEEKQGGESRHKQFHQMLNRLEKIYFSRRP